MNQNDRDELANRLRNIRALVDEILDRWVQSPDPCRDTHKYMVGHECRACGSTWHNVDPDWAFHDMECPFCVSRQVRITEWSSVPKDWNPPPKPNRFKIEHHCCFCGNRWSRISLDKDAQDEHCVTCGSIHLVINKTHQAT